MLDFRVEGYNTALTAIENAATMPIIHTAERVVA